MKNNQKNKTAEKEEKGNPLFYQYKVNNYCLDAAKYISNELDDKSLKENFSHIWKLWMGNLEETEQEELKVKWIFRIFLWLLR